MDPGAGSSPGWLGREAVFSPQAASGEGDDRAATRLFSWDATRATSGTGAISAHPACRENGRVGFPFLTWCSSILVIWPRVVTTPPPLF